MRVECVRGRFRIARCLPEGYGIPIPARIWFCQLVLENYEMRLGVIRALERARHRHVQFWQPAHENKDAFARQHPELLQRIRKLVGGLLEIGKTEFAPCTALTQPADRRFGSLPVCHVTIHGLVGDIDAATARQPVEQFARGLPNQSRRRQRRSPIGSAAPPVVMPVSQCVGRLTCSWTRLQ